MWPRLALNTLLTLLIFSACSSPDRQAVDKLNSYSYAYHYCNLDSVDYYASQALAIDGNCAEAMNNKAFVKISKMDYDAADTLLGEISRHTDNQLELLIAYVQQMRLCQRRSRNKEFYDYREQALSCLKRINEERSQLLEHQQRRLLYAETELAIVTSTYYYYVGLEQQSIDALMAINPDEVKRDTAQFLNYLYNIGAGGILTHGDAADIYQQEMDYLLRCYQIAQRGNYPYFMANALEAVAEHLTAGTPSDELYDRGLTMVNPDGLTDHQLLAIKLAEQSLQLFLEFGDVYQIVGAYRTLASCYRAVGDDDATLYNLEQALADSVIQQAPDLVASIYEQLSVAYAAVDDKENSDHYRNLYLDLHEQTRQDRQLESRAGQLDRTVRQLDWLLAAAAVAILLLVVLLLFFRYLGRRQPSGSPLADELEERREQLAVSRLHIEEGERRHLEQRARISLVNSLLPLIDRMVYTIRRGGDKDYICELTDKINADNELLTQWIQLRQGQLSLHIESFPLAPLFDMIARSKKSFLMKGVTLDVEPTEAVVKADRILTLFMLNTLADNARKFTSEGGRVGIAAQETSEYVEISVTDTGEGMDAEQVASVFNRQLTTHGFGLLNCKGIIEKYRKMSQLFSVCTLQAESEKGRGSRFFFRLPIGKLLAFGFWLLALSANSQQLTAKSPMEKAAIYADSAYFSNINGTYERTMLFADSCRHYLNEHYLKQHPDGNHLLLREGDTSLTPPEVLWLHDSVKTNYTIILDIRNECAVAALALHQWQVYQYNNRIYTQLFKELSADATLADYCRTMQRTKENRTVAVVLLLMAMLAILPVWYFFYLRPRFNARFKAERNSRDNLTLLDDELRQADLELQNLHVSNAVLDNCLSTLKHETMYYPSRIRQLIEQDDMESAKEVVDYYRELYNLLSQQAQSQVERVKLHLRHLDHDILGDDVLIRFLFDILKRVYGLKSSDFTYRRRDEQYVEIRGESTSIQHLEIDYLLCRQIVRDHGEATNRRACSIREEQHDNITTIIIILPAYGKLQSNHS